MATPLFDPKDATRNASETMDELLEFCSRELCVSATEIAKMMADLAYEGLDTAHIHQLMKSRTDAAKAKKPAEAIKKELEHDLTILLIAGIVRGTKVDKIGNKSVDAAEFKRVAAKYNVVSTSGAGSAKSKDIITIARLMAVYAPQVAHLCMYLKRGQAPTINEKECPYWLQFVSGVSIIPREGDGSGLYNMWSAWYTQFCTTYKLARFNPQDPGAYIIAAKNSSMLSDEMRKTLCDRLNGGDVSSISG